MRFLRRAGKDHQHTREYGFVANSEGLKGQRNTRRKFIIAYYFADTPRYIARAIPAS